MTRQIREAASVIVGRDDPAGVQVLVLERAAASRFLPGYVAFPGGAIDAEDAELARRWFGSDAEACRAGVVRELVEECGLAVTADGVLMAAGLGPVEASPPAIDQLPEVAHWIAPEDVPVRFDARFYAASAPGGDLKPTPDGVETAAAWWVSPAGMLDEWEAQQRRLYWPTYFTMRHLATCSTVAELLALRFDTREPDDHELEWLHRSTFYQD